MANRKPHRYNIYWSDKSLEEEGAPCDLFLCENVPARELVRRIAKTVAERGCVTIWTIEEAEAA